MKGRVTQYYYETLSLLLNGEHLRFNIIIILNIQTQLTYFKSQCHQWLCHHLKFYHLERVRSIIIDCIVFAYESAL